MSQYKETHLPCNDCGSSDALCIYNSGVSICYSCGTITPPEGTVGREDTHDSFLIGGACVPLKARNLHEDTVKRYRYEIAEDKFGNKVQVAPYFNDQGQLVAQKIRGKDKQFTVLGKPKKMGLFGLQLARSGGKMIVITEGEIDAMSVSQAMGNTWPAVSLPNGSQNLQAIVDSLELLESYEKVILCFDADEPGQAATKAALELFSPGKAYVAHLNDAKDANDLLRQHNGAKLLRTAIWEAKEHRPDGIVDLADLRAEIEAPLEMGTKYPWPGLNSLLFGFRPGELITWCAGTGVGKTAIISELEYDLVTNVKGRVGVIHLEEGCVRTARRMVGIHMNKPIHLPNQEYTDEQFAEAFDATVGTHRLFAYNHFGSLDSDVLLNRIRYLVRAKGCETVYLDHISMVVSGADLSSDERRMLDRAVTQLKSLTEETGVTIHMVSHLRRAPGSGSHEEGGQVSLSHLRGTQAIAQLSDAVIAAERDQQSDDQTEKNTTQLRVLKNRYAGLTGPADKLLYNPETGRLSVVNPGSIQMLTEEDF